MRRVSRSLYPLVILAAACSAAQAVSARRPEQFEARFDQIVRITRQNFYDSNMRGLDWPSVVDRYRDRARSSRTTTEFEAVVNSLLGELHASHTAYYTDDDMEFYLLKSLFKGDTGELQMEHIGLMGSIQGVAPGIPTGFVITATLDGGPARLAGLKPGDRIISADGRPFTTVGSFKGRAGSTCKLEVERIGVGRISVVVAPVREQPQRAFLEATERSARIIERNGKRIGYIHLWAMTNDKFRQTLDDALTGKLAGTDGLILDMRDGFGGHPFRFTDVLFRPDVEWSQAERGKHMSSYRTGYGKPLVVLINSGTRSAKESFVYQIKKTGRGKLVGTTTAGAFLGAGGFAIGDDGYLELPIVDLSLDGKRLEGIGVAPDVVVEPGDTYGPSDRQLERGLLTLDSVISAAAGEGRSASRSNSSDESNRGKVHSNSDRGPR